ncbi:MAG: hypothetical protein AAFR96_08595 [Planctomycetota bacterium]
MIGVERDVPARLLVPMCPGCGEQRVIRNDGRPRIRCQRCGTDLYTHRPRSYAEMEGLASSHADHPPQTTGRHSRLITLARRVADAARGKLGNK